MRENCVFLDLYYCGRYDDDVRNYDCHTCPYFAASVPLRCSGTAAEDFAPQFPAFDDDIHAAANG